MFLYRWATAWALIMSNKSKIIHVALWPHYKLAFAIMYVGMYACMSWASGNFLVYASMHVTGKRIFFWCMHPCMHVMGKWRASGNFFVYACMHVMGKWRASRNFWIFFELFKFFWSFFEFLEFFLIFWIFWIFWNFCEFLKFLWIF